MKSLRNIPKTLLPTEPRSAQADHSALPLLTAVFPQFPNFSLSPITPSLPLASPFPCDYRKHGLSTSPVENFELPEQSLHCNKP